MKCAHINVRGRVQGVNFRWFTKSVAQSLGLEGTVRNLRDGSVEIRVNSEERTVDVLLDRLREGNGYSRVDDVKVSWEDETGGFHGFTVLL